jgi:hypothetical protein
VLLLKLKVLLVRLYVRHLLLVELKLAAHLLPLDLPLELLNVLEN